MKTLISIVSILCVVGCGKKLAEKVVGTYKNSRYEFNLKEGGIAEAFKSGKKLEDGTWSVKDGKIFLFEPRATETQGDVWVLTRTNDGDLELVYKLDDGKREEPTDKEKKGFLLYKIGGPSPSPRIRR